MSDEPKPGADIVADAREWLARYGGREVTHSDGCHRWHDACLIARLVAECDRRQITGADLDSLRFCAVVLDMGGQHDCASAIRGLLSRTGSIDAKTSDEITERHAQGANVPERERLRLTAEEREALGYYIGTGGPDGVDATLRALLERAG